MSLKNKYEEFSFLPSLKESQEVQKYTYNETNFGYNNFNDILQDLYNEIDELKQEIEIQHKNNINNRQRIFEELGDILFVLCNMCNKYNINAEEALKYSTKEFTRRMMYCQENYNGKLKDATTETMLKLWQKAKKTKN